MKRKGEEEEEEEARGRKGRKEERQRKGKRYLGVDETIRGNWRNEAESV